MNDKRTTYLGLLFLSVFLLSSCAQEDPTSSAVTDDSRILFFTSLPGLETRSDDDINDNSVKEGFDVSAARLDTGSPEEYFSAKSVKQTEGMGDAFRSDACRWPSNKDGKMGMLRFFAFYPSLEVLRDSAGLKGLSTEEREQYFQLGYEPIENKPKQYWMKRFKVSPDITKHSDFVTATEEGSKAHNLYSGVTLKFQHQLSRIKFEAFGDPEEYDVEIAGVRIGGIAMESDFSFEGEPVNYKDWNSTKIGRWIGVNQKKGCAEYIFNIGDKVVSIGKGDHKEKGSATSIMGNGGHALVIPYDYEVWTDNQNNTNTEHQKLYFSVLLRVKEKATVNKTLLYPYTEGGLLIAPDKTTDGMNVVYLSIKTTTGEVMKRVYMNKENRKFYTDKGFNEEYSPPSGEEIRNYGWAAAIYSKEGETLRWNPGYQYIYQFNYSSGVGIQDPADVAPGKPIILTKFSEDLLSYKYFQWRDMPLGKVFPHGAIEYNQHASRDWRQHEEEDPTNALKFKHLTAEEGIDFYIPCNVWLPEGPNMSSTSTGGKDWSDLVKEDATHFTVVCREYMFDDEGNYVYQEDGETRKETEDHFEFCQYPSKDTKKQFEFKTNHFYKLEMEINGIPDDKTNPFFNKLGYTFLEKSNCYMLKRDSKELFAVPLSRINKYWGPYSATAPWGDHVEKKPADVYPDMVLDDDSEWVAEVIWQDKPIRLIDFVSFKKFEVAADKNTLEAVGNTYTVDDELTECEGTIPWIYEFPDEKDEDGIWTITDTIKTNKIHNCFAFRTTGSGEGNVIIGVRKKQWYDEKFDKNGKEINPNTIPGVETREYLWSWHIWITDYDPYQYEQYYNYETVQGDYKDVFKVPNGEIHQLKYKAEPGSPNPFVMDRNLGALSATPPPETLTMNDCDWYVEGQERFDTFGFYYQFGRKDPFPQAYPYNPVYDIDGVKIASLSGAIYYPPNQIGSDVYKSYKPTMIVSGLSEQRHIRDGVKRPYKFFIHNQDTFNWFDDEGNEENTWLLPYWMEYEVKNNKTFLDPCPPGWMIIDDQVLWMFTPADGYGIPDDYGNVELIDAPICDWDLSNEIRHLLGFYYKGIMNYNNPKYPDNPDPYPGQDPNLEAWFPTQGVRFCDRSKGAVYSNGQFVDFSTCYWVPNRYVLTFNMFDIFIAMNERENLATGCPVRCMRVNDRE